MNDDKEWRVIPDFPMYEITFDGEVRTTSQKSVLTPRQYSDEAGVVVTLWREGGLVDKDIHSLILNAFPEFRQVSAEARLALIKRFATEMSRWLGGEAFVYDDFEQLADIVIDEGWRPYE